jgi:hypothetical protein
MGGYLASDVFLWFKSEAGHAFCRTNGLEKFRIRGVLYFDTPVSSHPRFHIAHSPHIAHSHHMLISRPPVIKFYGVSRTTIESPAIGTLTETDARTDQPRSWVSKGFGWLRTGLDAVTAGTEQYIRLTKNGRPGGFKNVLVTSWTDMRRRDVADPISSDLRTASHIS